MIIEKNPVVEGELAADELEEVIDEVSVLGASGQPTTRTPLQICDRIPDIYGFEVIESCIIAELEYYAAVRTVVPFTRTKVTALDQGTSLQTIN